MTPKQESATLREIGRIYQNCAERVATYTRWRWIATATAWVLIFFAFLLSAAKIASTVCLVTALLGGFAGGLSVLFAASANQMPLFVRYTALREDELQTRLEKLKDG